MAHYDKVKAQPQHLERIASKPKLKAEFLRITDQPGTVCTPGFTVGMIARGDIPERCPECGGDVIMVYYGDVGRWPSMSIYGARCVNAPADVIE
jgi:hypothetical protein